MVNELDRLSARQNTDSERARRAIRLLSDTVGSTGARAPLKHGDGKEVESVTVQVLLDPRGVITGPDSDAEILARAQYIQSFVGNGQGGRDHARLRHAAPGVATVVAHDVHGGPLVNPDLDRAWRRFSSAVGLLDMFDEVRIAGGDARSVLIDACIEVVSLVGAGAAGLVYEFDGVPLEVQEMIVELLTRLHGGKPTGDEGEVAAAVRAMSNDDAEALDGVIRAIGARLDQLVD